MVRRPGTVEDRQVRTRSGALFLAVGSALWILLAFLVLFAPLSGEASVTGVYVIEGATVLWACGLMWSRARCSSPALARARRLLAAAMACTFVASLLAIVATTSGQASDSLSVDDLVHLCFVPLAAAALLCFPVSADVAGSRLRSLLDGSLAAAGLWFVIWVTVMLPGDVGAGLSRTEAGLVLAYPAGDIFLIGLAASVLARVHRAALRELSLLSIGLILYGAADVAYAVREAAGTYLADGPVSLLAELGILFVVAGSWSAGRSGAVRRPAWLRALPLLPLAPLALAILVGVLALLRDEPLSRAAEATGLASIAVLVLREVVSGRDQRALRRRIVERDELFRSLVLGSADLTTLHDGEGRVRYASPSVLLTLDVAGPEGSDLQLGDAHHPQDRAVAGVAWRRAMEAPGEVVDMVVRLRCVDGGYRWHASRMRNLLDDPSVAGVVVNTRDIHEQHLLTERVRHDAEHDALTGLGNLARARRRIAQACADLTVCSVLLVDLDGFKGVNDTYGHAQGDALLVSVAGALQACVRPGDEVLRIGGDEFLVVLGPGADAERVAERVVAALRRPLPVGDRLLSTGGSVGLADTAERPSPEELLRNADLAMYAAKDAGRNRWARYVPVLHESARARMAVQSGLHRALSGDGFTLHYQPVVNLVGGAPVAFEALLRWTDPELGTTSPDVFIPVAEECGLMARVDAWVLERACADLAAWTAAGLVVLPVSVNVSRTELTASLPQLVAGCLGRHGVPARLLRVEVTESAVVRDPDAALEALQGLRRMGVLVLLDDFGTGQSSLSQLARLPVDTVKIDKSFVLASSQDSGAARLLDSILGVCHALDLPVVAEGIETGDVAGRLAAHGCQYGQGWYFGRPAAAAQTARLLAPWTPLLAAPSSRGSAQTTIRIGNP